MANERLYKGKSIIDFPSTFTVIDIETTGLSPQYDEIIELSAIKVCDDNIVDTFSSLVKPDQCFDDGTYIDSFITDLTGITNEMLAAAPDVNSIFPAYISFLGNSLLLGHNINFDINFLYDTSEYVLSTPLRNDFVDTMRISRRLHPEFRHHRLSDLCKYYTIDYSKAHRALLDCEITAKCFFSLRQDVLNNYDTLESFIKSCSASKKKKLRASDIAVQTLDIDPCNPLYDNVFVLPVFLKR